MGRQLTNTVRTIEAVFPGTKTIFAIRACTSGAALVAPILCVATCDELAHELSRVAARAIGTETRSMGRTGVSLTHIILHYLPKMIIFRKVVDVLGGLYPR